MPDPTADQFQTGDTVDVQIDGDGRVVYYRNGTPLRLSALGTTSVEPYYPPVRETRAQRRRRLSIERRQK